MTNDHIYWNGIDGRNGQYLYPPTPVYSLEKLGRMPRERVTISVEQGGPRRWDFGDRDATFGGSARRIRKPVRFGGILYGTDPDDLQKAGWAVIFPCRGDAAIREALKPLFDLRRAEAGSRFRIFADADGYRPEETGLGFLERHGMGPGAADARKMPYYLLLVADPVEIPFEFQIDLGSQYAVGRLSLDGPKEYASYATSVVARSGIQRRRDAVFFGVRNPDDPATRHSCDQLVTPLAGVLRQDYPDRGIRTILGTAATKEQLAGVLNSAEPPALLFSASHGVGFPFGDPDQEEMQGALLCQDWPGPRRWPGRLPIPPEHLFTAADIPVRARLAGLVVFLVACFGAGTPQLNRFARREGGTTPALAPRPFLARLARSLLGHPGGTAAAVIGHVGRTFTSSFLWRRAGTQLQTFEAALRALLDGRRVGWAMDPFCLRRAQLASARDLELESGVAPELSSLHTAYHDAQRFVVLGDPAVRLS